MLSFFFYLPICIDHQKFRFRTDFDAHNMWFVVTLQNNVSRSKIFHRKIHCGIISVNNRCLLFLSRKIMYRKMKDLYGYLHFRIIMRFLLRMCSSIAVLVLYS